MTTPIQTPVETPGKWYAQVTRYQWLILAIASAGWVFDAFEGQVYTLTREGMLRELLGSADPARRKLWGELILAIFLLGGTIGGIGFGKLADRWGRRPAMATSILFYAVFSGLTCLATRMWEVSILRFLVALGVGGEWAVGAALVSEVFPAQARARAAGIFHATSVAGTWMAAVAGLLVGTHWRFAYLAGLLPALLVFWVMVSVKEPQRWKRAVSEHRAMGSFRELFTTAPWARHAIFGLLLAAVGLGTFWSVVVAGQDLTRELLVRRGWDMAAAVRASTFAYGFVQTGGMGLGLLSFGPISERLGRRGAFLVMQLCAVTIVPMTCYLPHNYGQMLCILPAFGFFCGGIHAGYAIYFPELFPDHLRATGAAVCFNGGRLIAAPLLFFSGELKSMPGVDLRMAVSLLGLLFLFGCVLLVFLPETKGKPLPT